MQRKPGASANRRWTLRRVALGTTIALGTLSMLTALAPNGQVAGMAVTSRASADQVWYQSVGRASVDTPCEPSSDADIVTGWSPWAPSWEQWANGGSGGFVCSRQITWARDEAPAGASGRTSPFGEIGPGGGLIFLRSGGRTYEMAPNDWNPAIEGPNGSGAVWCGENASVVTGNGVGTGAANTTAMLARCTSGAANVARAYNGGGFTDWYLPSKDELNAMCNFSRVVVPADLTVPCNGGDQLYGRTQNPDFENSPFGFARGGYWSSSQPGGVPLDEWGQSLANGSGGTWARYALVVRPIRSY